MFNFDYPYVDNENNIYRNTFDHRSSPPYNKYTYDNLGRLTFATYIDDANEVFTMDELGNRQSVSLRSESTQSYTANGVNNRVIYCP